MTDGGPARPRQLGKMECQERDINISADDWPKEENGGIEQTGESVRLRWTGSGGVLKTCFFLHQDFELGSNNVGA